MLELRSISVAYGAATAIWDLSLTVQPGELLCIVGPNGAGKSTLINTLAGLNQFKSGTARFNGKDLTSLSPYEFCDQGIALVPESRGLFTEMTVRENLELGSYAAHAKPKRQQTMDRVCDLFPVIASRLDQQAGSLSGGQQQMVAIGRALMALPKLLLLDEPSLGLAPSIVLDMFKAIQTIHSEGMAVLLVEQNVSMALGIAQRGAVLEEGRIVASGPPAELLARPEIRNAYLGTADRTKNY